MPTTPSPVPTLTTSTSVPAPAVVPGRVRTPSEPGLPTPRLPTSVQPEGGSARGGRTVLDAAHERLARVFADFDTVVVAFSGGKDSGALLHLVLDHVRRFGIDRPVHVFHLDYEAQFSATTRYVDEVMADPPDGVVPWRLCLPVRVSCATTMSTDHWKPWDPDLRDLWLRPLPDHPGVVHAGNVPPSFPQHEDSTDYEIQDAFARWLHRATGARRTAVLVGIRSQESLHRYSAIHRPDKHAMHAGLRWTSVVEPGVVKAYPVHDWRLEDVWHAHARFGWAYNPLYDLLHQAGVPPHQIRVTSPFIGQGLHQLRLYRVVEPATWARLVGRVNGANFAALYGGTSAMAARTVRLPRGHTWRSYLLLLLGSLPPSTRERYLAKFATSVRYWTVKGGALRSTTVRELEAAGVPADFLGEPRKSHRYSVEHEVVRFHDYPDDLPGIRDGSSLPTYRRMCLTVLRNDYTCRSMGFSPTKGERDRRARAMDTYQGVLG